jgi:hypothetical protein
VSFFTNMYGELAEFGVEKSQSLESMTDKQIEETVTGMVKSEGA